MEKLIPVNKHILVELVKIRDTGVIVLNDGVTTGKEVLRVTAVADGCEIVRVGDTVKLYNITANLKMFKHEVDGKEEDFFIVPEDKVACLVRD